MPWICFHGIKISTLCIHRILQFQKLNLSYFAIDANKKIPQDLCDRLPGNRSELSRGHWKITSEYHKFEKLKTTRMSSVSRRSALFKIRFQKNGQRKYQVWGHYFLSLRRDFRGFLLSVSPSLSRLLSLLLPLPLFLLGLLGSLASGFFSKNCLDFLFFRNLSKRRRQKFRQLEYWGEYRIFCSTAVARLDLRKSGKAVVGFKGLRFQIQVHNPYWDPNTKVPFFIASCAVVHHLMKQVAFTMICCIEVDSKISSIKY